MRVKQALIILAAAVALSSCVSHNFSEGQRTFFRCDGGKEFTTRNVAPAIEVYASGTTNRLEPVADGQYRSQDGAITLAQDGGRATLTGIYNGPFENCRRQTRWPRFF
jgi:hypothetical protein